MPLSSRAIFLILIVYSLLVFASLGATPLWLDEVLHFGVVRTRTWSDLIQWVQINAGGVPLSYLLQEGVVRVLGLTTVAARLPAALASLVGAIAFIAIVKRLKIGAPMLALVLFLVVPLQFRYAIEGVGYSLGLCFCVISFWTFLRLMEAPSEGRAAAYAISIVLGLYSQPLVIFPALAQVAWTTMFATRKQLRLAASTGTVAILAFLPWYLGQQDLQQETGTMKIVFFSWQQVRPLALLHSATGGGYVVAIPLILLAAYGFYRQRSSAQQILILVTLASAWVGPVLMDSLVNYFFAPRQLLFAVPFLVLLAASGAQELWVQGRAWVPVSLVAIALCGSLFDDYGQAVHPKDDLMMAAQTAQSWVGADGCIAVAPPNWVAYFTFFEPNLADRKCGAPFAGRMVAVRAAPATAQEREALLMAVPAGYLKKKEALFRDLDLTLYEPASGTAR